MVCHGVFEVWNRVQNRLDFDCDAIIYYVVRAVLFFIKNREDSGAPFSTLSSFVTRKFSRIVVNSGTRKPPKP